MSRVLLALVVVAVTAAAPASTTHDPRGTWSGRLMGQLRLVLHVDADSTGALRGSLDSPDQGASGLHVSDITFARDTLRVELANLHAMYMGSMSADGDHLTGEWHQAGNVLPLELVRGAMPAATRRSQEPEPPYPYRALDVRYAGALPTISLAGTLTVPQGNGPFPCALMITGSGPQDRDEMVAGHRPFLVIADHLTRAGIAVLRVDDRGVGGSTGSASGATSTDFAADVRAGIRFLQGRPEIDRRRIGLIGHSEGGLISPMVAARDGDVAFIVLLAGPGVPGREILEAQSAAIARAMGAPDSVIARQQRIQHRIIALAAENLDSAAVVERANAIFRDEHVDPASAARSVPQVQAMRDPWMRFFLSYDPRPALRSVRCPVLALNGSKDVQVPPGQNLPEIERALKAGGNRDVTVRELPGLNHLFQTCTTGAPTEYAAIDETFAPAALESLTTWITAHVRR